MATHAEKVTLEEAVQMSKCIFNISFRWIINENILEEDTPCENCVFGNTEVFWRQSYTGGFKISANFPYQKSSVATSVSYHFTSLEALREAYPKLFELNGKFKVIH